MSGVFLSFEGGEAAGKSVQAARLSESLGALRRGVLLTREPGGTPFAERIRDVLLHAREVDLTPETQALLFSAARAQHTRDRPALAEGKVVIADRYFDSTLAYQGYGLGADLEGLRAMTRFAVGALVPQHTFLIDVPVAVTLSRLAARSGVARWDRFHGDDRAFYERVRDGYLRLAAAEPGRFVVIDGDRAEEVVAADIRRQVDQLLGLPA